MKTKKMESLEKKIKRSIFEILSFKQYLTLLSKSFFLLYNLGLLKRKPSFKYHYFLKNMINKNDVIIDIGANLGYYSISFSKWVGENGLVYAVEPIAQLREVLENNIGKRKNIEVIPFALGCENKFIRMGNDTRKDSGVIASGSHFVLEENKKAEDEFSAEMRKGSEIFQNLEKLDFIKCDVEGYETVIIPEIKDVLMKHKPTMLIETRKDKRVFLLKFLLEMGFYGYVLEGKELFPASEINEKTEDDLVFIHKNKLDFYSKYIA